MSLQGLARRRWLASVVVALKLCVAGTGTPEAGGLTSRELLGIVRGFDGANVVGADIVEVAPPYDHAEITSIAAANLAYEFLSLFARQPRT